MKQKLFQGLGYHVPDRELSLPPCIADYFMGAVQKALEASSLVRIHSTPSIYEKNTFFVCIQHQTARHHPKRSSFLEGSCFMTRRFPKMRQKLFQGLGYHVPPRTIPPSLHSCLFHFLILMAQESTR